MAEVQVGLSKQSRSQAKRLVTVCARRLISSAERGSDLDILGNLMTELEKAYSDFQEVHIEFEELVSNERMAEHRVVGGEDIEEYRENVEGIYSDARIKYQHAKQRSRWSTEGRQTSNEDQHTPDRDIRLSKLSLPTFSGRRKDWAEFKAVWRELGENAYRSKTALAHELKRSVRGEAAQRIKSVYATKPEAYAIMWQKLEAYYDDTSASVQAALDNIRKLKTVKEEDYKAMIELVDEVESTYSQLEELDQLDVLTMRDVDRVSELLTSQLKTEWMRIYHDLSPNDKLKPFVKFMKFLERERNIVMRLAETQTKTRYYKVDHSRSEQRDHRSSYSSNHGESRDSTYGKRRPHQKNFSPCAFPAHRREGIVHVTSDCNEFKKQSLSDKLKMLMETNACFICLGDHPKSSCQNRKPCSICNRSNHHYLLCKEDVISRPTPNPARSVVESHTISTSALSLYPIMQVEVPGTGKKATIFCDGGSNTTYITHRAAERLHAKKLKHFTLDLTTMGNVQKTYNTRQYEVSIQTQVGKIVKIKAFGMERITGKVSKLNIEVIKDLFPDFDPEVLQRKSETVDILLGCDHFGLHSKTEVAQAGDNLSVMRSELGVCLQGTHPLLKEETVLDRSLAKTVHESYLTVGVTVHHSSQSHPEFIHPTQRSVKSNYENNYDCEWNTSIVETKSVSVAKEKTSVHLTKVKEKEIHNFVQGEEHCIGATPRCGGCRCGKCPAVGHTYSFQEEQELRMIRDNLQYDEDKGCWITSYPWITDPVHLPDNYNPVFSTLLNTERTLRNDSKWASTYKDQVQDMLDRQVARKLSDIEIQEWKGPTFYLSHLAVLNPKSSSTPVRIVFNSSQVFKGISLNSCLAKGPDCYLNNLVALLLRWREEPVAVVGDIKKMFNSIHLKKLEQHCHRFLWRDLETDRPPDIYVITRVNMGDTPAPAISTEAVYKTAEMFEEDCPRAAELLKKSSYVDDLVDSFEDMEEAKLTISATEKMLAKGGFRIKYWQFSGSEESLKDEGTNHVEPKTVPKVSKNSRVLGLGWKPEEDQMVFRTSLNFSPKKKGLRTCPDLTEDEVPSSIPIQLTRRMVLEQVMLIYDPLGLLSPFTLLAKIYLRETWELRLGWDEQLPEQLRMKWIHFFKLLFEVEVLKFNRCLHPCDAKGNPSLIILSDGSNIAYGFAAYVLWTLNDGKHWLRLIMSKCRIAPINRLSTLQMELNGAVLSKRAAEVLKKEMRFKFDKVLHLVDSETVLNMLNKTSTRFKVYEGVRIGEIQAATKGDMSSWAWISGEDNIADWLTRGRTPRQLGPDSEWWNGPSLLYRPVEEWGLKFGLQHETSLPGEKKVCCTAAVVADPSLLNYQRFSSVQSMIWVVARLLSIFKHKSFRGGKSMHITAENLRKAETFIVKDIQSTIEDELQKSGPRSGKGGRYSRLNPIKGPDGTWMVGNRLNKHNPMSPDSELQRLLPTAHYGTRLFMRRAHNAGHGGRSATLAKFRQLYWTPHGDKLAKSVKHKCQLCKLREPVLLQQEMGSLPETRLKPSPPFTHVMIDLFGPYKVRGEVQKRVTGKAYGVIFTDLASRAIHIEAVSGYDTQSFLMVLSRFASLRGWPQTIYSDPGTQLIGAERELREAWQKMDKDPVTRRSVENGVKWIFGAADSPWHQGAVESLIKGAKKAIHFAVHNQRLSVVEFLTVCAEAANLLNERPIGAQVDIDSDINVFTPNTLLLGRSTAKNPGNWQPRGSISSRFRLIQSITDNFWKKWTELYAPSLIVRQKWACARRDLGPGDVVLVADKNVLRGEYRLGLVKEAFPGSDGKVRRVTLTYKNFKVGEKLQEYKGAKDQTVVRSVQHLALLVPADHQQDEIEDLD